METITKEALIKSAMGMITHAGDARNLAKQARAAVREMQFQNAQELIEEAKKEITLAHTAQTQIIQSEARGAICEYSMLFNHAQDTLMTINSEIELSEDLIATFAFLFEKLQQEGQL